MSGFIRVAMLVIAAATICFEVPAREPLPLEAYARLPENSLVALSPDGKMIGLRVTADDNDIIVAVDIASQLPVQGVSADAVKPRFIMFPNSENMVIVAGTTIDTILVRYSYEKSNAYGLNLKSGEIGGLLRRAPDLYPYQSGLGHIVGLAPDGKTLFMPAFHNKNDGSDPRYGLYAINFDRARARRIKQGSQHAIDWFMDAGGNPLIREDHSQATNMHRIWRIGSGKEKDKLLYAAESEIREINLVGQSLDGKSMVILAMPSDSDIRKYYLMSLEDGEISGPVLEREGASIAGVISDTNRVVHGVVYEGFTPTYQFLDETLNMRVASIQKRLTGTSSQLTSWSAGFEKLLFHVQGGWSSGHYFIFEGDDQTPLPVGLDYPQISSAELAPTIITEYKARDGLTIPAILTGRDKVISEGNAPLIVLPHGGPESHDRLGFHWMAQFLASRGYLVLQPQFRGSDGFGLAHIEAGRGEWGGKMQSDLDDGVHYLVDEGLADPQRVCIVGTSYGGYAALAAGAFSPEMYSCVVSIAGVSDLYEMLVTERSEHGKNHWVVKYWTNQYGATLKDKEFIRSISPINSADKFEAPVLLLHGKDDTVVRIEQSELMHKALKRAGKDVTFVELKGEDHWLSGAETRQELLRTMAEFIEEHL